MKRRAFLPLIGLAPWGLAAAARHPFRLMQPEQLFFQDDGTIPNSAYPLLVYRQAFAARDAAGAAWLEQHFAANNWTNSWRNGVYSFHHYHSTSHEVLGVYAGTALLHLGGEKGQKITVQAGDIRPPLGREPRPTRRAPPNRPKHRGPPPPQHRPLPRQGWRPAH